MDGDLHKPLNGSSLDDPFVASGRILDIASTIRQADDPPWTPATPVVFDGVLEWIEDAAAAGYRLTASKYQIENNEIYGFSAFSAGGDRVQTMLAFFPVSRRTMMSRQLHGAGLASFPNAPDDWEFGIGLFDSQRGMPPVMALSGGDPSGPGRLAVVGFETDGDGRVTGLSYDRRHTGSVGWWETYLSVVLTAASLYQSGRLAVVGERPGGAKIVSWPGGPPTIAEALAEGLLVPEPPPPPGPKDFSEWYAGAVKPRVPFLDLLWSAVSKDLLTTSAAELRQKAVEVAARADRRVAAEAATVIRELVESIDRERDVLAEAKRDIDAAFGLPKGEQDETAARLAAGLRGRLPDRWGGVVGRVLFPLMWMVGAGPKVFRPTPEQAEALSQVDVAAVPVNAYKQPFPCLTVAVPPEFGSTLVPPGAAYPVAAVLVQPDPTDDLRKRGVSLALSVYFSGTSGRTVSVRFFHEPGGSPETSLADVIDDDYVLACPPGEEEHFASVVRPVLVMALNAAVLLTQAGTRRLTPETDAERRYREKNRRRVDPAVRERLAREARTTPVTYGFDQEMVIVERRTQGPTGEGTPKEGEAGGWQVSAHWRRGHWAIVRFGPGRADSRLHFRPAVLVNPHLLLGGLSNTRVRMTYSGPARPVTPPPPPETPGA